MSEPMSSVEIEDVLSSIRRLVSEDLRPTHRPVPPVADSKLILTPSLRVVPEPEPVALPDPEPEVLVAADAAPEAPLTMVEEAVLAEVDPAEAKAPPVAPEAVREAAPGLGKIVASVGAAMAWEGQQWEAEAGDPPPLATGGAVWPAPVWQDIEDAEPAEPRDIDPATAAVNDSALAEPEGPWAQAGGQEAPSFQSVRPPAPPAEPSDPHWVDAAEAEVIAALQDADPDPRVDFLDSSPELTFDEEVLRDLVRDLIREELQGSLGERITRNIRKLVRAEIARTMAAREFD